VKFARLASLQQLDFFQDYGFNLVRNEKGRYVLYRQVKRPPPSPPSDVSEEDLVKLLSPVLAGFNVVVTVNTPGRIVETTAPGPSAHTATWRFDFARDPNVLLSLQRFGMQIVFDGQGLDLPTLTQSPPAGAAKAADRPNA
jgi:hypothetical protein